MLTSIRGNLREEPPMAYILFYGWDDVQKRSVFFTLKQCKKGISTRMELCGYHLTKESTSSEANWEWSHPIQPLPAALSISTDPLSSSMTCAFTLSAKRFAVFFFASQFGLSTNWLFLMWYSRWKFNFHTSEN